MHYQYSSSDCWATFWINRQENSTFERQRLSNYSSKISHYITQWTRWITSSPLSIKRQICRMFSNFKTYFTVRDFNINLTSTISPFLSQKSFPPWVTSDRRNSRARNQVGHRQVDPIWRWKSRFFVTNVLYRYSCFSIFITQFSNFFPTTKH